MTERAVAGDDNVQRHTPRALCKECGDAQIVALCCNCTAFLCGRHHRLADLEQIRRMLSSPFQRRHRRPVDRPNALDRVPDAMESSISAPPERIAKVESEDDRAASVNPQFTEPKSLRRRHFCPRCLPAGDQYDLHTWGSLIAITLSILLLGSVPLVGVVVLVSAIAWFGTRVLLGFVRRRRRGRRYSRLLFLAPRIRKLDLTEVVEGRCELDDARQQSMVFDEARGAIDLGLRWTSKDATITDHYRKRTRADRRALVRAEAGHLVLHGAGLPPIERSNGCETPHPALISLRPCVGDHEVLTHVEGHGDARWDLALTYKLDEGEIGRQLAVWITPSFAPNSQRRALDLRVQWRTVQPVSDPDDGPVLTAKELSRVALEVPGAWGPVQQVTLDDVEQTIVGSGTTGRTRIEWKKPRIESTPRGSRDLSASFFRPVDESATVSGEVEIKFAEAVSGVTSLHLHGPGGGRRRDGARATMKTKVRVRFTLSLAGIQHQESRTVPDAAANATETESRPFPNTRPDQHLVTGLVQQLADQRFLVKSVVEHPARPGRGVGLQYRVWDVTGRRYRGVHPVDFRITISGDEAEAGTSSPSTASIRLIVRGVHASRAMEEEIVKAHEEIWARIETAVEFAEAGANGNAPRLPSEPLSAIGRRAARLDGTLLSLASMVEGAEREGAISTQLAERLLEAIESGRPGAG